MFNILITGLYLRGAGLARRFNFAAQKSGQVTVEYMLMLAAVVGVALAFGVLFHKKILGGFFTLIGMVIGSGKTSGPAT